MHDMFYIVHIQLVPADTKLEFSNSNSEIRGPRRFLVNQQPIPVQRMMIVPGSLAR